MNLITFMSVIVLCFVNTRQQNTTQPRRSGHHRDPNLMNAVQQIQQQLTTLDSENQRHIVRFQEITRATTRLETQRQEIIATLDRTESRIAQKLDDIKGDVGKIITLQDVTREDVDKMEQNQLLLKVWLDEQLRQIINYPSIARHEQTTDPAATLYANADILANLQILQSTLYSLRRMADTLQSNLNSIKTNLTDLTNITRSMQKFEQESLVTKTYFQTSLNILTEEKPNYYPIAGLTQLVQQEAEETLPRDCYDVQQHLRNQSGIYRIRMHYASRPIFVFCDMETDGGGWTVFQRRKDGTVDFLREWQDYKHGFGNVGGEFWLGNENLYLLTHQDLYELRIDLADFDDGTAFAKYGGFAVGSEKEKYMLKLLGPLTAGDAGDGMSYHASMPFSTIDMDNDRWEGGHCAKDHTGGWWYNQCDASNLNGQYLRGLNQNEYQGIYWYEWQGPSYSLMTSRMMIRPMQQQYEKRVKSNATDVDNDEFGELDL
ncbi:techylectin-5B-like [Uloborus diversus]|uniref:techylectin-5B-like n=1 Tax=Uloborus diversus TaxID=327109 RepID=UPI00240A217F|nr:techylectin-5B-like [Uloborus diversus]